MTTLLQPRHLRSSSAWKISRRRTLADRLATVGMCLAFLVAVAPLCAVLWHTFGQGIVRFGYGFLTHSMAGVGPLDPGGGIYHAMLGTLEQVLLATAISAPLGLLVAIFLNEYGGRNRVATAIRLLVDVMTGIPSIVAGLFVLACWVLGLHRGFSGLAAAIALAILMTPVVTRSAEEMLALVPDTLREAGYALGVSRGRVIVSIVLPAARAGITTGIMLAIARVTGETAPLLMTSFGSKYINADPFHGPQESLPLYVFEQAGNAFKVDVDRAWAAAMTLIAIVAVLYAAARLLTRANTSRR